MDSFAAREACQRGDYAAVLTMYRGAMPDASWTKWDYFYYALALRKSKNYRQGHEIARAGMLAFPDFVSLRSIYCWCLYYLYVQKFTGQSESVENFRRAVDSILKYSQQEKYSPYEVTVWKMIAFLKNRPGQYKRIAAYLRCLDPDLLSKEARTFVVKGKKQTVASPREKWYSLASRLLIKEENYAACIQLCEEALRIFPTCHHDNEIWFSYRIALSWLRQGKAEEAAQRLHKLLQFKQHWILYRGLFFVAQAQADTQKMRQYGSSALLLPGVLKTKVNFISQFALALENMEGYQKAAYAHYLLAKQVRTDQHWQVKPELLKKIEEFPYQQPTRARLQSFLHDFWLQEKHRGETPHQGTIVSILPGAKAGFIKEYAGNQYYFRTNNLYQVLPEVGRKVSFYLEETFQSGKKEAATRAIDIVGRSDSD